MISARRAEFGGASDRLELAGLELVDPAVPLRVAAPAAAYDFNTGRLEIRGGFKGTAPGFSFEGRALHADCERLRFEAPDELIILLRGAMPGNRGPQPETPRGDLLARVFPLLSPATLLPEARAMTPAALVASVARDPATFARCWSWIEGVDGRGPETIRGSVVLFGPRGGHMDLSRHELSLAGRSALLGPQVVLVCDGGLRVFREPTEDGTMLRAQGVGGVRGWMSGTNEVEIQLAAATLDHAGDGGVVQFEGGPLVVRRGGAILTAAESWQFVRFFGNGRMVLSPGSWHMSQVNGTDGKPATRWPGRNP